jgi:hypothetical protein
MPNIFKALASITVWVLFIGGLITLVSVLVMTAVSGQLYSVDSPPPIQFFIGLGVATFTSALAVVCMKLRQMLE